MAEYTKDEALVFIQTIRMTLGDKVGFQWLTAKLRDLEVYVDELASENEQLNAFLDATHSKADYQSYLLTHVAADDIEDDGPCST